MRDPIRHSFAITLIGVTLAGCQTGNRSVLISSPERFLQAVPDGCGATAVADLRGQPFTALADRHLPGDLRIIRWNEAVTSEIEPRRINAMVDERGMVLKFFCG